jgi:hypothetical protein
MPGNAWIALLFFSSNCECFQNQSADKCRPAEHVPMVKPAKHWKDTAWHGEIGQFFHHLTSPSGKKLSNSGNAGRLRVS